VPTAFKKSQILKRKSQKAIHFFDANSLEKKQFVKFGVKKTNAATLFMPCTFPVCQK